MNYILAQLFQKSTGITNEIEKNELYCSYTETNKGTPSLYSH